MGFLCKSVKEVLETTTGLHLPKQTILINLFKLFAEVHNTNYCISLSTDCFLSQNSSDTRCFPIAIKVHSNLNGFATIHVHLIIPSITLID